MTRIVALVCGLLCGAGFLIAGFYDPALVHEVLERDSGPLAAGLALFAAVFVAALLASIFRRPGSPYLADDEEPLPDWTGRKALASALVFGLGWGLAGYFPLSALVSAGAFSPGAVIFLISVLSGVILFDVVSGQRKLGGDQNGPIG
ncbi:MAG: hypothetical protein NXI16_17105 [Alphaproteobacteria bacterium]|nr:hypothetical protein [Alphaproteobacteria bacterium]